MLFSIYNDLIDFDESKRNREEFAIILSRMMDYCLMHFKKEEAYMEKFYFPENIIHKKSHKDFIYKVAMYNVQLKEMNSPEIEEVKLFLKNWLLIHILKSDKKYEDFKKEIQADVKY